MEVLSDSTDARDRGFKFAAYRELDSLCEYVMISQKQARIEVYRRKGTQWVLDEYKGLAFACKFESVGVEVPLAEIYREVQLPATGA